MRNEVPLDKVNAGSGNEIACQENTGIYIMNKGHVKASIFIDEKSIKRDILAQNDFRVRMIYAVYLCLFILCLMLDAIISSLE